jgi:hypothetical protein
MRCLLAWIAASLPLAAPTLRAQVCGWPPPGEEREVTLVVLDDGGEPLVDAPVDATVQDLAVPAVRHEREGRTDAAGRLTVSVPVLVARWREPVLILASGKLDAEVALRAVTLEDGRGVDAPAIDLGVVRLGPIPLLVEGRVVDHHGRLVAGALVRMVDLAQLGRLAEHAGETATGDEGRFAFRRRPEVGRRYALRARVGERRSDGARAFEPGAEVELAVAELGAIRGSLRGERPRPDNVRLVARSGDARREAALGAFGALGLSGLWPGTYGLEVRAGEELLLAIAGVDVAPGSVVHPPGLDDLAPTGLRAVAVRVSAHDRRALPVTLRYRDVGGAAWSELDTTAGAAVLATLADELVIRVAAPGYRLAERVAAAGDALHVELAPGLPVRLVAEPALDLSAFAQPRLLLEALDANGQALPPRTPLELPGGLGGLGGLGGIGRIGGIGGIGDRSFGGRASRPGRHRVVLEHRGPAPPREAIGATPPSVSPFGTLPLPREVVLGEVVVADRAGEQILHLAGASER